MEDNATVTVVAIASCIAESTFADVYCNTQTFLDEKMRRRERTVT